MKKALVGLGLVLVLALVYYVSTRESGGRGTPVQVDTVSRRTISSRVKATGQITPKKKVQISAKVVGEITRLNVREGDHVTDGEILLQIEPDVYEAVRNQARAALEQAQEQIRSIEVRLADAKRTLHRRQELFEQGLTSQEQLDAARVSVDTETVQLAVQRHAVEQARSSLKRAEDDLKRTIIRSPMDGYVIRLNTEKGETVVPGSTNLPGSVLMTVADMSRIQAEVGVGEVDIVNVKLGQKADIRVDALEGKVLQGRVTEIATSGVKDPAQGVIHFKVKIDILHPDPELRPSMTAKVDIITAVHKNVLAVPIQAVVKRPLDDSGKELRGSRAKKAGQEMKKDVVYLFDGGKAALRQVTTGISDELWVEIEKGLAEGDRVIVGPYRELKSLHDGDEVRVEKEASSGKKKADDTGDVTLKVN
ncbi:MAG: efflux RND transporter periplasmic adaptor subunit [Acidobacteria bacterium]|nr:efflux RND transporter periplasmic adaptor subunit [Acidobacteriota bacterium]